MKSFNAEERPDVHKNSAKGVSGCRAAHLDRRQRHVPQTDCGDKGAKECETEDGTKIAEKVVLLDYVSGLPRMVEAERACLAELIARVEDNRG